MKHKRLFIPGPTEVRSENLAEMARPQIGHRSEEFSTLYAGLTGKLRTLFGTSDRVFPLTCASTGAWEAAVRNCVGQRVLCCVQGAFSERWHRVAEANGKAADRLDVEWGRVIPPERIDEALGRGGYDALTLVHNETSTGVINPLDEIAAVMRRYPEVLFLVDAVSSLGGARVAMDEQGIDVCVAGVQKALALPPGLALAAVSRRALDRAATVEDRGYYFDFLELLRYDERNQTPATPAIPQMRALDAQLDDLFAEGMEQRIGRHAELAGIVREWAVRNFALFAESGHESPTVTCVANTRDVSIGELNAELGRQWVKISDGYGKLKQRTFRIAHMGDTQEWEIRGLLAAIDRILDL